ncbi:MAG: glycosyltransferase [Candidatus Omnitrophica bacterium]|nr:glycosyltransferase [Candidatus Omnitrophota bacterium]
MSKELIIVPAFNEESNIKKIIEEINIERPFCDCIVVNDGSIDRTEEIVREMGKSIISHPINLGAGAAIQREAI